jgi:hypothetical protein
LTRNRKRLLTSQSLGTVLRAFSSQRVFRNMRRLHFEWNAGVAQQFLATRRSGSEH